MAEQSLVPIEQKEIHFYDDKIVAVQTESEGVYVPIRPICNNLGISPAGQRERIGRDAVLSKYATSLSVVLDAQARTMLCLPLKYVAGWLFGINANRVKGEVRDLLIRYQEDCYDIIHAAFQQDRVAARTDSSIEALLESDDPTAEAYRIALAVVNIAREQLILKSRLDDHELRFGNHEQRLQLLEARGQDESRYVDNAQASKISQAVKAIAIELGKRSGRNEFGGVYGELYRRFEITGYRELPAVQYDEAIGFLRGWYASLTGDNSLPF